MQCWYERYSDESDYLYFFKRIVTDSLPREISPALFHTSVEFAFCLEGEFNIYIDRTIYTVSAGDIVFIPGLVPHAYYYTSGVKCYIILISRSFFNEQNGLADLAFPTLIRKSEHFEKILQWLDYMWSLWDKDSLSLKISFCEMFVYLMKKYFPSVPLPHPSDIQQSFLQEVIMYICLHFNENLDIRTLARRFGYSPNYFSALFNRSIGMKFRDYLNAYRIIEYKKLRKRKTDDSVATAAQTCGFGSMKTFYRAYNKYGSSKYE